MLKKAVEEKKRGEEVAITERSQHETDGNHPTE